MPFTPEQQQAFLASLAEQAQQRATSGGEQEPGLPQAGGFTAPAEPEPSGAPGFGFGDFIPGAIADPFRAAVPEEVRDIAGAGIQNVVSGERFVNTLGGFVGQEGLGTRIGEAAGSVPVAGRVLRPAFDTLASPLTIATAGFGPAISGSIRGTSLAARGARAALQPVVTGGLPTRVAAETALGVGTSLGSEALGASGVPGPVAAIGGLGLGIAGAGTIAGASTRRAAFRSRNTPEAIAQQIASSDPVENFVGLIRKGKRIETGARTRVSAARAERFDRAQQVIEQGGRSPEAITAARRELSGELPRQDFEAPRDQMTPDTIRAIHRQMTSHEVFSRPETADLLIDVDRAFWKVMAGQVPSRSELNKLSDVFGDDFVAAVRAKAGRGEKFRLAALDVINVPRAVASSMDVSGPFRQGAGAVTRPEFWRGLGPMVKAFGSEDYAPTSPRSAAPGSPSRLTPGTSWAARRTSCRPSRS
jgi:hypothetical protein